MLRPSAFCDLESRPRRRSSRPSVGAIGSISGAAGGASVGAGFGLGFGGFDVGFMFDLGWRASAPVASGACGSGSCTSEMDRFGASRGIAGVVPDGGKALDVQQVVSPGRGRWRRIRAWVNEIVDDAVYPPDLSTGLSRAVASSGDDRLIRRRR